MKSAEVVNKRAVADGVDLVDRVDGVDEESNRTDRSDPTDRSDVFRESDGSDLSDKSDLSPALPLDPKPQTLNPTLAQRASFRYTVGPAMKAATWRRFP